MDCVFCKIINGEIPCYKIYEDEFTLAFLDISGDVDGHTLVISKNHVTNVLDCDSATWLHVANTVQKVSQHFVRDCGFSGVNILNANDKSAGQSVFHLHVHVFPRKEGDGAQLWPQNHVAKQSLEKMHQFLSMDSLNHQR